MQSFTIVGRVGSEPKMRFLPSGKAATTIPVCHTVRGHRKDGSEFKETMWVRATAYGRMAELINEYVKKGDKIFLRGSLSTAEDGNPRLWEDAAKKTHASFEMIIGEMEMMSRKVQNGEQEQAETTADDSTSDTSSPF